ncbi:SAM-dependent methyltransferase [Thiobacter aerophilum]|uniref:SAM-dependent methyltransferase n=1 Tax=Thiobacter aerophilum TaxID=3121275 RepID=A0ABV0EAE9_9BURK
MNPGTLYLIPTPLGEGGLNWILPQQVQEVAARLGHFIVEHPKTARAFLKRVGTTVPLSTLHLTILDEHTPPDRLPHLLAPLRTGHDVGLMSEAGCPAVADPGAALVRLAHQEGIPVVPLVGPSALMLALMASGLEGQRFTFHGYLPVAGSARKKALRELEVTSRRQRATQLFIETPYRNTALLQAVLEACHDDTLLCVAMALTTPQQRIVTRSIAAWKASAPLLEKLPAVFCLQAG